MSHPLMAASTRVALAAYLHDLGKFAERGRIFEKHRDLPAHLTLYCPFHKEGGWYSHRHAANTALAFDLLEPYLPDLLGPDATPFVGRTNAEASLGGNATDSLINASAAHHKPDSFLQWVIATADRVASGFEREDFERYNQASETRANKLNHFTSRQLTLFEQLRKEPPTEGDLKYRYPLKALAPRAIFPVPAVACEFHDDKRAQADYALLWQEFIAGIKLIPATHRGNLALWLDHFDSLWLNFTQAIPAATAFGVRPEVSLYDHSRTTAALAVALWRWHTAQGTTDDMAARQLASRADYAEEKFFLIQGDFFGIQDFIFAPGGDTRKHQAKLLRGRSFQVALFTELAALKILDALGLPPTSQVTNAAGKFLIVAPNTPEVRAALLTVSKEIDDWFLDNTFGLAGMGLAKTVASAANFLQKDARHNRVVPFADLMKKLRRELERAKHQRFSLCQTGGKVFSDAEFALKRCVYNDRLPADKNIKDVASAAISRDQILIGESLLDSDRLLILQEAEHATLPTDGDLRRLEKPIFGYVLAFARAADNSRWFGRPTVPASLRRCWDFSLPSAADKTGEQALWAGYARRFVSGYAPRVEAIDVGIARGRYTGIIHEELPREGDLKTLDMLACEDRQPRPDDHSKWQGVAALAALKGDIDNLGELFHNDLPQPSFAKMAALSRQLNSFFAIYLPWLLASEYPDIYTVFAGGDDFFLLGPWRKIQKLASRLSDEFQTYVAKNPQIHFSAGIATQKPGAPINSVADLAEHALAQAKALEGKNAVTCFGETVKWQRWADIENCLKTLENLKGDARLSHGFLYSLQQLVALRGQEETSPPAAIWRARLAYRARRFINDTEKSLEEDARKRRTEQLRRDIGGAGIQALGTAYRIVLFNHLYTLRDR